jgi:hypothetical protein
MRKVDATVGFLLGVLSMILITVSILGAYPSTIPCLELEKRAKLLNESRDMEMDTTSMEASVKEAGDLCVKSLIKASTTP